MKRIYVIKEKCNGCMNCVVACQKTHADSEFYAPIRDTEPTRIHLQAMENSPAPLVCQHCEEPACVKACITGAMRKHPETGVVSNEHNRQKCIGCWMCIMACPFGMISPKQEEDTKVAVKCDLCVARGYPACIEACPTGALIYAEEEEFRDYKQQLSLQDTASMREE